MFLPTNRVGLTLLAGACAALALAGSVTALGSTQGNKDMDSKRGLADDKALVASTVRVATYGHPVKIKGKIAPELKGETLFLERLLRGRWMRVKIVVVERDLTYTTSIKLKRTTKVRITSATLGTLFQRTLKVRAASRTERVRLNSWVGKRVSVSGAVRPATVGREVSVTVKRNGRQHVLGKAKTKIGGKFQVTWTARSTGIKRLRLHIRGDRSAVESTRSLRLNIFAPANASYYGPGFIGGRTACGQTMTSSSVHVAHRTLPCGTKLKFYLGGKVVDAVVKDRGPYVSGRLFDLSVGLKNRLGFGSTGVVGYLVK